MAKKSLKKSLVFLVIGSGLTLASLFFFQDIGLYKKVSGWPFAAYEITYERVVTLENEAFVDTIAEEGSVFKWEIFVLDILLWAILFELVWVGYHKLPKKRIPKAASPSLDKRPA